MVLCFYFNPAYITLITRAHILQQSADNSAGKKTLTFVNVLDRNVRGHRGLFYRCVHGRRNHGFNLLWDRYGGGNIRKDGSRS